MAEVISKYILTAVETWGLYTSRHGLSNRAKYAMLRWCIIMFQISPFVTDREIIFESFELSRNNRSLLSSCPHEPSFQRHTILKGSFE